MNDAIKLAIKGGYEYLNPNTRISCPDCEASFNCHYALDPLFWQALGKALGWGTEMFHEDDGNTYWDFYSYCPIDGGLCIGDEEACENECDTDYPPVISWLYHWHHFIDHLAEGRDADSYFKEILNLNT